MKLNGCNFETECFVATILAPLQGLLSLSFSVRCPRGPQNFAHKSATWKRQTQHFSFRSQEDQLQVHHVFLGSDQQTSSLVPSHKKKSIDIRSGLHGGHFIGPRRPIHPPVKWLSSHARSRSTKYGGAPSWMKCSSL